MASPAQVANDMAARADFWIGRDGAVRSACLRSALIIRQYLIPNPPDPRAVTEVLALIYTVSDYSAVIGLPDHRAALARAAETITQLRKEARDAQT